MKIVVTGSLGHISKPLTALLLQQGHSVTVISSNPERTSQIEEMGAKPAIGSVNDVAFLTATFKGADIVYLMEPPFNFFDYNLDLDAYWINIARSYVQAVEQSGVTKLVHLSSIGAHRNNNVGILSIHHEVEKLLSQLPATVSIKTMRPVGFYYNMFAFISSIKNANAIIQNYGGDEKEPWVSPIDIATVIAEEINRPFTKRSIRYIASDEVSPNEVATILGNAIGNNNIKWTTVSDTEFISNLVRAGFSESTASRFAEMNAGRRNGILYEDYIQNKPELGNIKLADFAKEFARLYNA